MEVKFSIITPTLLRQSLIRTCDYLNKQTYGNWEHILVVDYPKNKLNEEQKIIIKNLEHPKRKIIFSRKRYNNYGNTNRYNAYKYVTGNLIGYIDDDDYFDLNALELIHKEIKDLGEIPNAIVYPASRFGQKFYNLPPASCMTVTGQYMHKPVINKRKMQWIKVEDNDNGYLYDGEFIKKIRSVTDFTPLNNIKKPLVYIERASHGKEDPKIGVLISFYNPIESHKEKALKSVEIQKVEGAKIQLYTRNDTETKFGIAKSYNMLMQEAFKDGCTHIFIMAGDDWLDEGALQEGYNIAVQGYSYIPFSYRAVTEEGKSVSTTTLTSKVSLEEQINQNRYSAFVLMNYAAWEETRGYREDLPEYVSEDWDIHTRATKLNFDIKPLSKAVYNYRLHKDQASRSLPLDSVKTNDFLSDYL